MPVIVRAPAGASPVRARRRDTTRSNNSRGCTPGTTNESPNNHAGVAAIPSSRARLHRRRHRVAPFAGVDACALTSADGAPPASTSVGSTSGSPMSSPADEVRLEQRVIERRKRVRPTAPHHLGRFERAAAVRHVRRRPERHADCVALAADRGVHRSEAPVRLHRSALPAAAPDATRTAAASRRRRATAASAVRSRPR